MAQGLGCVERYCKDGDAEAFARVVEQYRPMVTAICRRYVIEPGDVEDAVQETFVKLSRRAEDATADAGAWLATVAGTTALDYARRSLRERARRKRVALERRDERRFTGAAPSWKAIEARLNEALEGLDPAMRSLVMARFFAGEAVKEMARRSRVNSSTMSRRVAKAVSRVRRALKAMGYGSMEETMLAGEGWELDGRSGKRESVGRGDERVAREGGKIRVGVLLSHQSSQVLVDGHYRTDERHQLATFRAFQDPKFNAKFQLISLLEPGTEEFSHIEQGLREHQIIGGVLDATDAEALKTLDVIVLGHCYAVTTRMLDAVIEAVESGVGLYHSGFVGMYFPGLRDARVRKLLMTDFASMYHTPWIHGLPRKARVVAEHPMIAGIPMGSLVEVYGCGPSFIPHAGAKVLMVRDDPVHPQDPPDARLNGQHMPVLTLGRLGKGREAIVTMRWLEPIQAAPGMQGRFAHQVLEWLAEERVGTRKLWAGEFSDVVSAVEV